MGKNAKASKKNTAAETGKTAKELAQPAATKNLKGATLTAGGIGLNIVDETTPKTEETAMNTPALKPTKEQLVTLAKELNTILDLKIPVTSKETNTNLTEAILKAAELLTPADFGEVVPDGDVVLSAAAKETYSLLGLVVPVETETKTAEQLVETVAERKTKKTTKKTERKYTRSDAAAESIRELCAKENGATLAEIVKRTDELYVKNGGNSVPDAINVNKYALNGLVAFKVLTLKEGRYTFTKPV